MTTIALPTLSRNAPAECEWGLASNTQAFRSPLSGAVQTLELPGPRWRVRYTWPPLAAADAALMMAFLAQLRGQANRFSALRYGYLTPRGTLSGTPLVNGAGQTGATLAIDGCGAGTTLLKGDLIAVGTEMKMVVADATANGSGQMTLTIEPVWRASPADNAAVVFSSPTCAMMLDDNSVHWVRRNGGFTAFEFAGVEVF